MGNCGITMKTLFREAEILAKEAENIMIDILVYNPDIRSLRKKISIQKIQHKIAILTREYSKLYKELGEKLG